MFSLYPVVLRCDVLATARIFVRRRFFCWKSFSTACSVSALRAANVLVCVVSLEAPEMLNKPQDLACASRACKAIMSWSKSAVIRLFVYYSLRSKNVTGKRKKTKKLTLSSWCIVGNPGRFFSRKMVSITTTGDKRYILSNNSWLFCSISES